MIARRRRLLVAACAVVLPGGFVAVARAQSTVHRMGYLMPRAAAADVDEAFFRRLHELGYTVGANLEVDYRWAGNDWRRLPAMAEELVRIGVDVIVTATTAGTRAAMGATRTIPIVMAATADPVAAGLVASLGRPAGNVTGMSLQTVDIAPKRLQQLREIVPGATRIGLLAERVTSPSQGTTALLLAETKVAAQRMGVELVAHEIAGAAELVPAFERFRRERAQALIVQVSPLTFEHRRSIVAIAERERLPTMYEARDFVAVGGLVSYGPDLRESYRLAATYVDRILKGARPGDLPVQQPQRLALIINGKAAKALGLTIPHAVSLRADEWIE